MLLWDIITRSAAKFPTNTAIVYRDNPTTYAELQSAIERLAAGMLQSGIRRGDRIALLLPNSAPFILAYYASTKIGAICVPANPQLKPPELEYIWRDAGIKMVFTVAQLLPIVYAARTNLPYLKSVVSVNPLDEQPDAEVINGVRGLTTLTDMMASGAQALATGSDPVELSPDLDEKSCAVVIYTSGTTGHPKGAMLSHFNLTRNVEQIHGVLKFTEQDRFLTVLPLYHSFAATVCMNTALAGGCMTVLLENFAPAKTLETLEKYRITIFAGVPALYNALLQYPAEKEYDLSALRLLVSGGAPLPAAILLAVEDRFKVPVLEGDGPTECSPVTSVNPLDGVRKAGSVGPAVPDVQIAIFDDTDNSLPVDEIGEIVVRGDNVMLGYLNQPEATAEAMTSGWYHTGDLGYIDTDGYVFIVDRKKDMIISSGLNIYPREIEEVLYTHEGVQDAAVIGVPDAKRGEEVLAVVVRKTGSEVTERSLISFCRERLANYKLPRTVLFRDTLPRGSTGKVVKGTRGAPAKS